MVPWVGGLAMRANRVFDADARRLRGSRAPLHMPGTSRSRVAIGYGGDSLNHRKHNANFKTPPPTPRAFPMPSLSLTPYIY